MTKPNAMVVVVRQGCRAERDWNTEYALRGVRIPMMVGATGDYQVALGWRSALRIARERRALGRPSQVAWA